MFEKHEATYYINRERLDESEDYEEVFEKLGRAARDLFVNRQIGYGKANIGQGVHVLKTDAGDVPLTDAQATYLVERISDHLIEFRPTGLEDDLLGIIRRAMDKLDRMNNLVKSGEYKATLDDEDAEGVEDSALDAAVYMFIFILKLRNLWESLDLKGAELSEDAEVARLSRRYGLPESLIRTLRDQTEPLAQTADASRWNLAHSAEVDTQQVRLTFIQEGGKA